MSGAMSAIMSMGVSASANESFPPELAMEQIMKNQSLPPCSLSCFMDYLIYVEESAENLQFFLWYCDYVERWTKLLPRQKLLSPVWSPDQSFTPGSFPRAAMHRRSDSDKLEKIIHIMEEAPENKSQTSRGMDFVASPSFMNASQNWQPYTIQPFRDEIGRVLRHYIVEGAPRQLDLFPHQRSACTQSVHRTTHPSSLLSAFLAAENVLRTQSYPAFIRWGIRNSNKPRLRYIQILCAIVLLLGIGLDVLFILSSAHRAVRIICLSFWWPGLTALFATFRGICPVLHARGLRSLRPWEQFTDCDDGAKRSSLYGFDKLDYLEQGLRRGSADSGVSHSHTRTNSSSSTADPLRKPSLQTFGPANDYRQEAWIEKYAGLSLYLRIFAPTALVQNQDMRALQDRAVFACLLWAGAASTFLTVVSVFVPSAHLF